MADRTIPAETADYMEQILVHYFRLALERAGVLWDSDFAAELAGAVEPVRELERRVGDLERDVASLALTVGALGELHV